MGNIKGDKKRRLDESFSLKELKKSLTGETDSEIDWDKIHITPSGNINVSNDSQTSNMSEKLLPCPFCGSEEIELAGSEIDPYYVCICGCVGPDWKGPYKNPIINLRKKWNSRKQ